MTHDRKNRKKWLFRASTRAFCNIMLILIVFLMLICLPTVAQSDIYIVQFNQSHYFVNEGEGYALINITLDHEFNESPWWILAYYNTINGTANNVSNFHSPVNASYPDPIDPHHAALFENGLSKNIFITILDDDRYTVPDKNFSVALTYICSHNDTSVYGINRTAIVTIIESSPTVQFKKGGYTVSDDAGVATLNVTISHAPKSNVTVHYSTSDNTAVNGTNYEGTANSTITFPAGATTEQSINIPIIGNSSPGDDKTFNVYLTSVDNEKAGIGKPNMTVVTISSKTSGQANLCCCCFPLLLLLLLLLIVAIAYYLYARKKKEGGA